ncbi:MAG: sulfite exporter TauE/SafE family protein [Kiritimatiellales bacterium]
MGDKKRNTWLKPPWLEANIMIAAIAIAAVALTIISNTSAVPVEGEMPTTQIVLLVLAFFLISFVITVVARISGIGGGVLFTPIMLAFTPVNSLIIRATGLIVAMFGGLISTGVFMKNGLGNFRMSITLTISQGVGAFVGAQGAVYISSAFGAAGEGPLRLSLGIILAFLGFYFISGGKKMEYPPVEKVDRFTKFFDLDSEYYERSEHRIVRYRVTRLGLGFLLTFIVGLIGGFFGMGAGWAITPVQNLGLGVPLKAAAANSGIILGMVDCVAVWPYILSGSIIPLFVLPWLIGNVSGGYIGALLLSRLRVHFVRIILIGIMFFTSFGLFSDALFKLGIVTRKLPPAINLIVFLAISLFVIFAIWRAQKKRSGKES